MEVAASPVVANSPTTTIATGGAKAPALAAAGAAAAAAGEEGFAFASTREEIMAVLERDRLEYEEMHRFQLPETWDADQ